MNDCELILAAEAGKARAAALKAQAEFATLAPAAQGASSLVEKFRTCLWDDFGMQSRDITEALVKIAEGHFAASSGASEPVEQPCGDAVRQALKIAQVLLKSYGVSHAEIDAAIDGEAT